MSEDTMETKETGWTKADVQKLLAAMKDSIPKNKRMNCYTEGLKSLDWNKVAFPPFSPEACKQKWTEMLEKMCKIRTLTELIVEAQDVIASPVRKRELKQGEMCTEDEESLPPRPPNTGYMLFCKEQLTSMGGISRKNKLDVCGQRWQELSETEKEKYRTNCAELKRQYRIKLNEYLERFDKEEQQQILWEKGIKTPKKHTGEECTEDEEGLPPRPPHTGYMLFCKEQLTSMGGISRKNKLDVCGQRWQELSETEKEKYRTNCAELKRQYRIKLNEYLERFDKEEQQQILWEKGIKTPKKHTGEECTEDEEGLPPRPPHTGYMLFCKEQLTSMGGISRKNKLDVCGQHWQELSETEKEKYRTNCTELKRQYKIKLNEYLERFDKEEQQQILWEKGIKTPKKHTGEECTEDEEGLPPRPPQTGYMLFCKEQLTSMGGISRKNKLDVCGQRWQELSETEKEKYRTNCAELKRQYKIKLNEYLERFDEEEQQQIRREKAIKRPKKRKLKQGEECTEDEEGLPPRPPHAGYNMFCKEQLACMPGTSKRQKFNVCGQRWRELSETEKEKYHANCTELKRQYKIKLNEYLERFDEEERQQIRREKGIRRPKKRKLRNGLMAKGEECTEDEEGPPPRPPHTAYNMFCKEQLACMPGTSKRDRFKVCSQRWREMSETEKEKYHASCTELKRQYRIKLNEYLERFDEEERQNILKKNGIKTPKKHKLRSHLMAKGEECAEDEEGLPPRPPHTAYNMFCKEQLACMPGTSKRDRFKVCSQRWREMSETEKEKYHASCTELNRQYRIKLNEYLERFDEEERQKILKKNGIKTPKKHKLRSHLMAKGEECTEDEEGLPPRPPHQRWRELSETEKEKYHTSCTELKRQYRIKLNEYLERFDKEEQQNILRKKGIKTPKKHKGKKKLVEELPGEPKMPSRCGNVIFCGNQMELLKEKIPDAKERFVKANRLWQELSSKEKEHYKRKVDEKMEKYSLELQKWFKTQTPAEQKNYLTRNPKKHKYLKAKKTENFVKESNLCQPSDSEDDDIEFSEEESDWDYDEDEEEEEGEDEEDAMFEM